MTLLCWAISHLLAAGQAGKPAVDPLIGKEAPELDISEWIGEGHALKDFRGKVVVLEFFQMI